MNWAPLHSLAAELTADSVCVVDARVLRLHKPLQRLLHSHPVLPVRAGESLKSIHSLERIGRAAQHLTRRGTLLAIGGGTVGDVSAVAAHLIKRGVNLVHVPTTVLAAVDSSVGGKGAVNVAGVKNALGVFHQPARTYLVESLFSTLLPVQHREGALEGWKMAVTLDAKLFAHWSQTTPTFDSLVFSARALKTEVCSRDPLETKGLRVVLNFGHTFGHVLESATHYRLRHGDAVGLGMLCALDIGQALGVTPTAVAQAVERALPLMPRPRAVLARALRGATAARVEAWLSADKKRVGAELLMVLLEKPGRWRLCPVPKKVWLAMLTGWKAGAHI